MKLYKWLKKKSKKNKKKIKYKIRIVQTQYNQLNISGEFGRKNYKASELWLFARGADDGIKVAETEETSKFNIEISLNEILDTLTGYEETTFDWYFKIIQPLKLISSAREKSGNYKLVNKNGEKYAEYFIRCGRFQNTDIQGLTFFRAKDNFLTNYVTKNGNLSVVVNKEPNTPIKHQIDNIKRSKGRLRVNGKLFTKSGLIKNGEVILKGRNKNNEINIPHIVFERRTDQVQNKFGFNQYNYSATININENLGGDELEEDIYDLHLKLDLHDRLDDKYIRMGRPTFRAKYFTRDIYAINKGKAIILNPYFTFRQFNLSFEVYKLPIKTFSYLRRIMRWSWLLRALYSKKDVWLVGEQPNKAQDTGIALFKYIRVNHSEKTVFYVIDNKSPEIRNIKEYGNLLEYRSKEHIWYTLIAKKVISSHHPDYLYPVNTPKFQKKVKADKVFLQHGVIAMKNVVANYGKNTSGFDTDIFIVSSEREKDIIVKDYDYKSEDVFVTGLSRFDTLFKKDIITKRQLLIIPTWRDWIVNDEAFLESEYYSTYKQLINDKKLHELADDYNFEVVFCLHPNMQKFSSYFKNPSVRVISQGEVNVQQLIKESSLMITDYSSVGFDFSFLDKPIIFYHFDRQRFVGRRKTHIDFNTELPGEVAFNNEQILSLIKEYAANDFIAKGKYKELASRFLTYKDLNSSKRIYEVINGVKVQRKILENPRIKMPLKEIYKRYRKSKYYYPTMKFFYSFGSKFFPVDKRLILFESGLGKQYGDHPRKVYEEILKRGLEYKKVWIYNKKGHFNDPDTIQVKRLSPRYFYYLFRARYWVNSQNFPTYIEKRAGTTYLQTWHGTPLKKMLYDIEHVYGRTEDYVERVGKAVQNWDYLLSPSPYATKAFRSAFRYEGEILEVGYPRNDIFYQSEKEQVANGVRNKLNIGDKKVILYAPTFRDDQHVKTNKFIFDIQMDLEKMKQHLEDEYVLLIRTHVVISNKLKLDESLKGFVYNVSNYPDIQELLLITDILITDYSSVMFDYANTARPMIFYTYDLNNYKENVRGFYMDFEMEAPGPLVFSTNEIIEKIANVEDMQAQYKNKYEDFRKKYCPLEDGKATDRLVDILFQKSN